jgi:hypothetical protein
LVRIGTLPDFRACLPVGLVNKAKIEVIHAKVVDFVEIKHCRAIEWAFISINRCLTQSSKANSPKGENVALELEALGIYRLKTAVVLNVLSRPGSM